MEAALADLWVGRTLAGRYRLVAALGAGGTGTVYEAEQLDLGRRVAIKLMRPELADDETLGERFRREARTAAQLGHPHIAQLFDFVPARGGEPAFLVLELVPGRSLYALLRNEAPLAPARAVTLATQILSALAAAHAAGIVHRDIKPGNVMVAEVPALGEVAKVLDFGIARVMESDAYQRLTSTGVVMGTPRYMSPEQLSGGPVDGRADLWAVGIATYAMLTGRFPFDGSSADLVSAIMTSAPPPMPRELRVPAALEAAVRRALEKDASARYPDAAAMIAALRAALGAERAADGLAGARPIEPARPIELEQSTRPVSGTRLIGSTPPSARVSTAVADGVSRTGPLGPAGLISADVPPTRPQLIAYGASAPPPRTDAPRWRWLVFGGLALAALLTLVVVVLVALWLGRAQLAALGVQTAPQPQTQTQTQTQAGTQQPSLTVPQLAAADGVLTYGTSGAFVEDATRRAQAREADAQLVMLAGFGVDPATGVADTTRGGGWSFTFVGGSGVARAIGYGSGRVSEPTDMPITSVMPPLGAVLDSAELMGVALRACPTLSASPVAISVMGQAGGAALSVSTGTGATWVGHLDPWGRPETTAVAGCR